MKVLSSLDRGWGKLYGAMRHCYLTVGSRWIIYKKCKGGKLTTQQIRQINEFYAPYTKRVSKIFHKYYLFRTGDFQVAYLPHDLYKNYIDPYYNDGKKSKVLENKCYYSRMFPDVRQPEVVCYRLGKFWYTAQDTMISLDKAKALMEKEQTVVVKQAIGSSGGHAVKFVDNEDGSIVENVFAIVSRIHEDIIIQRPVIQHPEMAKLNDSSLNTLRVVSLLREEGATIYSTVLRMGRNGSRVDNESSGGINCGVMENGCLRATGYTKKDKTYTVHPDSGVEFAGYQIPSIEKVHETVKRLHPLIPHFRLVSWDFAVDHDGEPVFVEANLSSGGIHINQINNGPFFGKDTKRILDEVFFGK